MREDKNDVVKKAIPHFKEEYEKRTDKIRDEYEKTDEDEMSYVEKQREMLKKIYESTYKNLDYITAILLVAMLIYSYFSHHLIVGIILFIILGLISLIGEYAEIFVSLLITAMFIIEYKTYALYVIALSIVVLAVFLFYKRNEIKIIETKIQKLDKEIDKLVKENLENPDFIADMKKLKRLKEEYEEIMPYYVSYEEFEKKSQTLKYYKDYIELCGLANKYIEKQADLDDLFVINKYADDLKYEIYKVAKHIHHYYMKKIVEKEEKKKEYIQKLSKYVESEDEEDDIIFGRDAEDEIMEYYEKFYKTLRSGYRKKNYEFYDTLNIGLLDGVKIKVIEYSYLTLNKNVKITGILGEKDETNRVVINTINIDVFRFEYGEKHHVLYRNDVIVYDKKENAIIGRYEEYENFVEEQESQKQIIIPKLPQKPKETKRFIEFEAFSKKPVDVGFIKTFEELSQLIKAYENRDKAKIKEIIEKYGDKNE